MFAQCGDHPSEWLAWLTAAKASQITGDNIKAQDYAKRGADLLSGIQLKWGPDSFNSYLKRPDIQYFHQWLGEIRAE